MVGLFKRGIKALIKWALVTNEAYDNGPSYNISSMGTSIGGSKASSVMPSSTSLGDYNRGMNFTVYNATGGKVVELKSYDPRTDRVNTSLYIVREGEELGEELAQIITRENLTR